MGSVVELPDCHTQAKTVDELMEWMWEAVVLYLEAEEIGGSSVSDSYGY